MEETCMYLRKSRADIEAEQHGEGETLERHEKTLMRLAKAKGLFVERIYKEVVSGETIASRPQMQQLLVDIESGTWDNVLVMEVERLARGDTIDQGIVSQTFKYSNTKIMTPMKTYHPNNEYDEEYFEFGLFMSRREYNTTKRRMLAGKSSAANEGKFPWNRAPYGYEIVKCKDSKGFTLSILDNEAEIVRMVFDLFVNENMGVGHIARRLNELNFTTRTAHVWTYSTLQGMVSNPVYIGKVRNGYRKHVKQMQNGNITSSRPINYDCKVYDGLHEPIIDDKTFEKAQRIIKGNKNAPIPIKYKMKNPLSGLVICSECGRKMSRRPHQNRADGLMCQEPQCKTVSTELYLVEEKILEALKVYISDYEVNNPNKEIKTKTATSLLEKSILNKEKELSETKLQQSNLYDLLEKGIYTAEVFMKRSEFIKQKIAEIEHGIESDKLEVNQENCIKETKQNFIPKCKYLLENYYSLDAEIKNELLKELLIKVKYTKLVKNKRGEGGLANFKLKLYPRAVLNHK